MWAGMTPQAPCTKNCITNAPTISSGRDGANAQMGMTRMAPTRASAIVRRRPRRSEYSPHNTPPVSAPTCENAVRAERVVGLKPQSRCRKVGYMSWVPCDTMFIIAMRTVR